MLQLGQLVLIASTFSICAAVTITVAPDLLTDDVLGVNKLVAGMETTPTFIAPGVVPLNWRGPDKGEITLSRAEPQQYVREPVGCRFEIAIGVITRVPDLSISMIAVLRHSTRAAAPSKAS